MEVEICRAIDQLFVLHEERSLASRLALQASVELQFELAQILEKLNETTRECAGQLAAMLRSFPAGMAAGEG